MTKIEISIGSTDAFFGFLSTSTPDDGGALTLTAATAFTQDKGRLSADQKAEITVTRTRGTEKPTMIELGEDDTDTNEKVGNDVAKLLDANNAATFDTAQELKEKLVDLAIDALPVKGLAFDSASNILTYEINLTNDLFQEDCSGDGDLDLGPLGDIQTVDDPKLTIGGSVGFNITFGIDLSSEPSGQSGIEADTELTDLQGVDEIADLIKTSPSITARNAPDMTTVEATNLELELDRIRLSNGPSLSFNADEAIAVSADTLVGNLAYLVAPDGFVIHITDSRGASQGDLQQQSLAVPERQPPTVEADRLTYQTDAFDFILQLDDALNAITGDPFTVSVAAQTFTVSSDRVFKSRWLNAIERAITKAQNDRGANSITRSDADDSIPLAERGSWIEDGFAVGQIIEITGSDSNNGLYEIESVSDDTIGLVQDLAEAGEEGGVQIEGPGIIRASDAAAFDDVEAGEVVQLSGSLRNDGLYLVDSKSADGTTLILTTTLEAEPASEDIELLDSGASLRLDPADGNATFTLEINGESYDVELPAEADPDDPFAPNTADNQSLIDLVQDLRSALSRATDSSEEEVDLRNRVEVGLDGMRLVLTMATGELADDTALSFASTGSNTGLITRSGADDGDDDGSWADDGFEQGQLIRIEGSDDNDGLYRITATDPDEETVIAVERLDSAGPIVDSTDEENVEVEGAIAAFESGDALAFASDGTVSRTGGGGDFRDEGFEMGQLIVIERSGSNDGTYVITGVTPDSLTLENPNGGSAGLQVDNDVSDALISVSFRITDLSKGAKSLGFGSSDDPDAQAADLHDFIVVSSDGEEHLVTLDGATTVGEVLRRIEEAAGGSEASGPDRIRARIAEDGTGIELVERGQLTGTPRLTFEEAGNRVTRSEGDWQDDGFAVGDTIRISGTALNNHDFTITAIRSEDPTILVLDAGELVESEDFVRDAEILNVATGLNLGSKDFRVELVNGSVSALGLGILRKDAERDQNQDGTVDREDQDGLIEGSAIGGASIFDRIFIQDPELSASLFLRPSTQDDQDGIDIEGNFGFFEAALNANGSFFAEVSLTLIDPGEGVNDDGKITLREIAVGLQDIFEFIDVPRFAGNSMDDSAILISFSNQGGKGRIEREAGAWEDDDFHTGQMITLRNAEGRDGDYLIESIESSEVGGLENILVLSEELPAGTGNDSISTTGDLKIVGAIGTLTLSLEEAKLGDFVDFAALGDDAGVVLTLFDFGDPFFRETVGQESKSGGTVTFEAIDQIRVVRGSGDAEVDETLDDLRKRFADGDELSAKISYTSEGSDEEQTASAKITEIDTDGRIRVDEDFVDDVDGLTIQKVRFTNPPRTQIDTPDLGNLLDFENISFLDIVRGLQLAS
ncbi:MAG: hypothetical protein JRJ58_08265, partial [Deltaproteobacteria bacterium]|nr:hypothetical protein [Deltaproteobacteria bacterium]